MTYFKPQRLHGKIATNAHIKNDALSGKMYQSIITKKSQVGRSGSLMVKGKLHIKRLFFLWVQREVSEI